MLNKAFQLLIMGTATIFVLVSCSPDPESLEPGAELVDQKSGFQYEVATDSTHEIRAAGNEFHVPTDNCGSRTSAVEEFSRSREFEVTLNAEISESLRGQLGGDIVAGELEAAIGARLGLEIGATESISTKRQITTPPDSITDVTLQWEELWQPGFVTIVSENGEVVDSVPFRVLTTVRLSQIGIIETPCGTITPEEPSAGEASSSAAEIPDSASTTTDQPGIGESPPVPTASPVQPSTTPLGPTDTQPPPTPTSAPPTDTPVGMVNAVFEVDAYRTALGNSANTGVYLQASDQVSINYLYGEWHIGQSTTCNGYGDEQTPTTAAGYLGREGERVEALISCDNANKCRPLTNAPWGSLLGSIGENGALFHIGEQLDFVAQDSGILHLRINYFNHNAVTGCPYGDGGEISVEINVTPQ